MATAFESDLLQAAQWYADLGFAVFPCVPGEKRPLTEHGLLDATTEAEQIQKWWTANPSANIAIRTDGMVVIDIDGEGDTWMGDQHVRWEDMIVAPSSATPRGGRHYLFRQPEGKNWRNTESRLAPQVDTRANGGYIVAPPSSTSHGSYFWIEGFELQVSPDRLPEPPGWLIEDLDRLATKSKPAPRPLPNCNGNKIPEGQRNGALTSMAGTMRRVGMEEAAIAAALHKTNQERCSPPLDSAEVDRIAQNVARYAPNEAAKAIVEGKTPTKQRKRKGRSSRDLKPIGEHEPGTIDPQTGRLILSTDRTLPTAEAYVHEFHDHHDGLTLRHYAGMLMRWRGNRYVEVEDDAVRHRLLPWMHAAVRMVYNPPAEQWIAEDFPANPRSVNAALDSIKTHTHLPATTSSPSWLDDGSVQLNPREIVPCRSSLLYLPSMQNIPPTPRFFCVNALDYDHDPTAPRPAQWERFLTELFADDEQSWHLLQEWAGYCLTGDTSQQKMLLIVGPKRSGKGTIERVLTRLVGPGNVCGPTTSGLAGNFGLQPLIGKSLAIVSDARFSGEGVATVIERLLCISGEDTLTVDRKHMTSVTLKLPTRFMLLTNELPRLHDSSGALAGRFLILRLMQSFYGREDTGLTDKLLGELSGILNWAIEGWRRLRTRGRFIQPGSVVDMLRDMEDLASPVGAFVRDCCDVGPEYRVWIDALYREWQQWCEADGRMKVTTKQIFGRDLTAVVAGLRTRVGTDNQRFYQGVGLKGVLA